MGEEVGTTQIRVLGEIKRMNKLRGENKKNIQSTSHQSKKKERKKKKRLIKISPSSIAA
jgi:hypothetical protein